MHGGTHIRGVSEDDALAVVVADGFGRHGDGDERPVDFEVDGNQQEPLGEQVDLKSAHKSTQRHRYLFREQSKNKTKKNGHSQVTSGDTESSSTV